MSELKQGGFTIIETSLFISISALLFATLVFGIQYMVDRAKFSDSVTGLQTLMRAQYEEVRSGINSRNDTLAANVCGGTSQQVASGSSDCLLMGKLIRFSNSSSKVYIDYVIGDTSGASSSDTDVQAISNVNPRFSTIAEQSEDIQWQSTFVNGVLLDGDTTNMSAIAILRSPISSAVVTYALPSATAGSPLNLGYANSSTALIVKNASTVGAPGGAVCVNSGSSSASISSFAPVDPNASFSGDALNKLKEQCAK